MINFEFTGKVKEAKLSWRIRKQAKEQFIDPLFIFKEAINNTVEDALDNDQSPEMEIQFKKEGKTCYLLFQDSGSGISIDKFMRYGESTKKDKLGRYGHGFKDTALNIGNFIAVGCKQGSWMVNEDKEDVMRYGPINDLGVKEGTCFIIPLKKDVSFEWEVNGKKYTGERAISEYIKSYADLALYWKNVKIVFNGKELDSAFPDAKKLHIKFDKRRSADGLLLSNGSGIRLYTQGGFFLDSRLGFDTKGMLLINIDCIAKEDRFITPTKKISFKHHTFTKIIEPGLIKWMRENGVWYEDLRDIKEDKELSRLLKPFISGSKTVEETHKSSLGGKSPRPYVKSGKYKNRPSSGGVEIYAVHEPKSDIYLDITPGGIFKNKAHPLHKLLKQLPKKWRVLIQVTLCASRAVYLTHDVFDDLEERREDWRKEDIGLVKSLRRGM